MMRSIALALLTTVLLASCDSPDGAVKERVKSNAEMKAEMMAGIDSLEQVMRDKDLMPGDEMMGQLLREYLEYADKFPGDQEHTPKYLYQAAALSRAVDLPVKAIKLYDRTLTKYPNWEKAPEVAFLQAATYDEDLKEPELAKTCYQKVIDEFPGDFWAVQAEQRLQIGMSDEDLLKFLEEKQKEAASN